MEVIKEVILDEFPWLEEDEIMEAIEYCCKKVNAPRPRERFLECLKKILLEDGEESSVF